MSVAKHIKQLGSDTVVYGISGTLSRFLGIFLVPLYTRAFVPAELGLITLLTALVGLLSTTIVLGLDSASGRWFYDTNDGEQRKRVISSWFWAQMTAGLLSSGLVLLFAPQIASRLLDSPRNTVLVSLAAAIVPLSTFGKVLGNWLRYERRAWTAAAYFAISSLGTLLFVVLFVLGLRAGVAGVYSAQLVAALLTAIVAGILLGSWIAPRYFSAGLLREMLGFGLPLIPAGVAAWITASSDRFILKLLAVPTAEIGIYGVAASISSVMALVIGAFQLAWGPFAYSLVGQPEANYIYSRVLSIYSLLACFLGTAITLFMPALLYFFITPDYYAAASSVPWLVFAHVAIGTSYIFAIGPGIAKKSLPVAISVFLGAAANTALNFIIIPRLGRDGAAISTFVAYGSAAVYLYVAGQRIYRIPYQLRDVIACLGLSALLVAGDRLLLPAAGQGWYLLRAAMCLLFVPLAFGLGVVRPEHLRRLVTIGKGTY